MPRIHTEDKKKCLWNLYSTIVDDYLFEQWLPFEEYCEKVVEMYVDEYKRDLQTLTSEHKSLNYQERGKH